MKGLQRLCRVVLYSKNTLAEGKKSLLTPKWICPIHAEPVQYVLVPPNRYDHIQQVWRSKGKWTLSNARNKVINNFTKQFDRILAIAHVDKGTFHDIRKTAITHWFRQGLKEYEVMTLAGHANFSTTHRFYLAVANDLIDRAREATTHQVSQELLRRCCQNSQEGANR